MHYKVTVHLQSTYNIRAATLEVIPVLKGVVADFERTSATSHLHRAALLLVGYAVWCVCVCVSCVEQGLLSSTGDGV